MKSHTQIAMLATGLALLMVAIGGADDIRVKDVPSRKNEVVTILGTVGARHDDPATSTRLYELADEWNDKILVRTDAEWPIKGVHYRVTGTVYYNEENGYYLHESHRVRWDPAKNRPWEEKTEPAAPPPPKSVYVCSDCGKEFQSQAALESHQQSTHRQVGRGLMIAMAALTVLVFLGLLGVLAWVITTRGAGGTTMREGSTIKMTQPTQQALQKGTVKVLPGRFEVLSGEDELKEVRLWSAPDNPSREFRLARVDGGAKVDANTIGFSHQSVSSNQGKIVYTSEGYTVINYADPETKNPIVVNGEPMEVNGSRKLEDGDVLGIGVVQIKYHAQA